MNESVLSGVLPLKRWGAIKAALSNWPCVIKPSLAYQPICSHQPYLIFSSENLSGICFFFFNVNNLLLCFVSFLWFYFAAGCYYEQTKDSSPLQQSRLFGFFINNIWQPASTQHIQSCLVAGRFCDLFNIHCTVYSTGKVSPVLFVLKHRILPAGS